MSITTISIFAITLSISIVCHVLNYVVSRRPKFVVIGKMSYKEFNSWHKAKMYLDNQLSECQVFIYEKGEYTFITSSTYVYETSKIEKDVEI